jgi:REP element-mobilizing transposase RayT
MERLRRLDVHFDRYPAWFVTACTEGRAATLASGELHGAFLRFAKAGAERGAWIGAYVLMPDHFHAFVALDGRELTLSAWMKSLKNSLSKTLRGNGVAAPHWQKGFFDHVLRSEESYSQKWEYVRENPVRAGLVERWEDWPYGGEVHPLGMRDFSKL